MQYFGACLAGEDVAMLVMEHCSVRSWLSHRPLTRPWCCQPLLERAAAHESAVEVDSTTQWPPLDLISLQGGDLRKARLSSEGLYGWAARGRDIALDIARGLQFLHSKSIIHRCVCADEPPIRGGCFLAGARCYLETQGHYC